MTPKEFIDTIELKANDLIQNSKCGKVSIDKVLDELSNYAKSVEGLSEPDFNKVMAVLYLNTGSVLATYKYKTQALDMLERAVNLDPCSLTALEAHAQRAYIFSMKGDMASAQKELQKQNNLVSILDL